ncbi:nucleotidyltransferase family protein [candidate division KSB1 bacterium]|nr:nucleotidyltransferase family protein [candidate division KSB1 bacterium]
MAKASKPRPSLEQVFNTLRQQLPELRARYGVRSLGIFGSFVRGDQKKRSDLDVLVEFHETPDLFQFLDLKEDLRNILGIKIDLVSKASLRGKIGTRILDEVVQV